MLIRDCFMIRIDVTIYVKYMAYVQDVYNCNGFDIVFPFSMHTLYVTYILCYYPLEGQQYGALILLKLNTWGNLITCISFTTLSTFQR